MATKTVKKEKIKKECLKSYNHVVNKKEQKSNGFSVISFFKNKNRWIKITSGLLVGGYVFFAAWFIFSLLFLFPAHGP